MSDTPYVAPTVQGRALCDLGQQLAAMRAERDALRKTLERVREHIAADASMQQCDGSSSCWSCFCENELARIDAALNDKA
jgi:hypothetical protein